MKINLLCVFVLFALVSCTSARVVPINGQFFSPLPPNAPVYIYSSEKDITDPYKIVGILSLTNPGKYRVLSLANVIPQLQKQARKAGANGIIIDETHSIKSGIISTGIGVTARAIRVEKKDQ